MKIFAICVSVVVIGFLVKNEITHHRIVNILDNMIDIQGGILEIMDQEITDEIFEEIVEDLGDIDD